MTHEQNLTIGFIIGEIISIPLSFIVVKYTVKFLDWLNK